MHSQISSVASVDRSGRRKIKPARNSILGPTAPQNGELLQIAYQDLFAAIPQFDSLGVDGISAGTRIETDRGYVPIQYLKTGDMIRTADRGFLPLLWKGSTRGSGRGREAPVLVESGPLGNTRAILVSPRQRLLLSGWRVNLLFTDDEVLASAKSLVNDQSIWRFEMEEVVYFHLLLSEHSIIFADGCATESLHLTTLDWQVLSEPVRRELSSFYAGHGGIEHPPLVPAARPVLTAYETGLIRALM